MEDYRAVERTFQTLVQVAGRAGREKNGNVVIQTYNPDHYAIIDSSKQDYDLFYNQEVALRKMLKYPPFCDIILIRFSGKKLNQVKNISEYVYKKLISVQNENINIYKPVPSPIDKIQNNYRWRIIIKCKVTSKVLDIINYSINDDKLKKSKETKIIVDINPNTMN